MLTRHRAAQGLTLIELVIGMAIVGILALQSFPFFNAWVQNTRIRTSAESILNGLQLARSQAVRSNFNTEFVLIPAGTDPTPANIAAVADGNGSNWIVRTLQPGGNDFVQGYTAGSVIAAPTGSGTSAGGPFVAGSFVFTPLGRLLNPPPDAQTVIRIDSANSYTDKRHMCIIVSSGGQALMCDPGGNDPNNPQFCSGAC